jgi:hypothetical protein
MKVLICLKVKYGYPLSTLYGFLQQQDYLIWATYLSQFASELVTNEQQGNIFWLVNNCGNFSELADQVRNLPLLKEEFLELTVLKLTAFSNLDCLFSEVFGR